MWSRKGGGRERTFGRHDFAKSLSFDEELLLLVGLLRNDGTSDATNTLERRHVQLYENDAATRTDLDDDARENSSQLQETAMRRTIVVVCEDLDLVDTLLDVDALCNRQLSGLWGAQRVASPPDQS